MASKDEMASKLVFWKPIIKKKKRKTSISPSIIDALMNDTGMENVKDRYARSRWKTKACIG